jgi:predicted lactoylglutathione lyase
MLLTEKFFATFTTKPIANAHATTEILLCLSCESRNRVDELVRLAVTAGGSAPRAPIEDTFGYGHGFEDLDGHIWELTCMQPQQG